MYYVCFLIYINTSAKMSSDYDERCYMLHYLSLNLKYVCIILYSLLLHFVSICSQDIKIGDKNHKTLFTSFYNLGVLSKSNPIKEPSTLMNEFLLTRFPQIALGLLEKYYKWPWINVFLFIFFSVFFFSFFLSPSVLKPLLYIQKKKVYLKFTSYSVFL